MARAFFRHVVVDRLGNVIQNAAVFVYQRGTTDAPTGGMFDAPTGGNALDNPLASGVDGAVQGWAGQGQDLTFHKTDNLAGAHYPADPDVITFAPKDDDGIAIASTVAASAVEVADSESLFAATDVEDALAELSAASSEVEDALAELSDSLSDIENTVAELSASSIIAEEALKATAHIAENITRGSSMPVQAALATGLGHTALIRLPACTVTTLHYTSGSSGANTPTSWYLALYDATGARLRMSANQGSAAIAQHTVLSVNLQTSVPVVAGFYYVMFVFNGTTAPTFRGVGVAGSGGALSHLPPVLSDQITTSTPPLSYTVGSNPSGFLPWVAVS